jgi:RNA polymerase sigma-70 factor, ECF subfamily
MTPSPYSITQLLVEWRDGDETALDRLMPLVYDEMRRMAHQYMRRERPGHTMQTSDLLNDAYLRLVGHKGMRWQNRAHFYAVAAQAMRRILVDHGRIRNARKRKVELVDLDQAALVAQKRPTDLVALDEALSELEAIDPRKSKVVVMKYFGGMKDEETAAALGISTATVSRDWDSARLWLLKAMNPKVCENKSNPLM